MATDESASHDALTNTTRPLTDSILTIRVIKSFEFRTTKNLLIPHADLTTLTVGGLKDLVKQEIQTKPGYKPFRTTVLDTMKLYTKAHGSKTQNLIINLDHDDWILDDESAILSTLGIENEAELSFFNRELYDKFKLDPTQNW
ncbi:protein of DUF0538 family [Pseudohyphozyma bogoriensis]|nr:protein of DUF0538 family [Pseudohyphozyma bogoriensis]